MKINVLLNLLLFFSTLTAPAQYAITALVSGLNQPVAFAATPDGRLFITEKQGLVKAYDTSGNFIQVLADISDSVFNYGECGLLGICVDPQFSVNHYLYIYYNHYDSNATSAQPYMRVLRYTESNNAGTSPLLLLDIPQPGNNHVGGNLHFSPFSGDKLFISIGENTIQANAQLTDNPYGKILRINADGSIPADNPFYDDGNPETGNDDRIWAYGLRNSFDFAFSPVTGSLYATENGPFQDDEVNMIHAGSNYAWPVYTGYAGNPLYTDPMFTWTPTVAPTGILYYRDTVFPQFDNHLLVGIFKDGFIYDLTLGNAPDYDTVTASSIAFNFGSGSLHSFTTLEKASNGCIYALNGGFVSGILYRICPQVSGLEPDHTHAFKWNRVYPVPATGHLELFFNSGQESFLAFNILDAYGRILYKEPFDSPFNGIHHKKIDLKSLSSGVYFLVVESNNHHYERMPAPFPFIVINENE